MDRNGVKQAQFALAKLAMEMSGFRAAGHRLDIVTYIVLLYYEKSNERYIWTLWICGLMVIIAM